MNLDDMERLARAKKPLPEFTRLPDSCYYWAMRQLYELLRLGKIDRESAGKEKRKLIRQYREFAAVYESSCAVYKEQQEHIRSIGILRTQLHRSKSVEEKLGIALQCISMMTGENVTEKMEIEWMEE